MPGIRILLAVGLVAVSSLGMAQTVEPHPRAVSDYALIDTQHQIPLVPPPTPRHDVTETFFGHVVHDPYRWLEDGDAPAVKQWIAAQNAYAEKVIDGFPGARAMAKRVGELAITSTTRSAPLLAGGTLFYLQQTPPQPQPVLVAQSWPHGAAQVLVDPNKEGGRLAITGFWPSPNGRYLAYGTATGGSELTTLHVLDVKTGKTLPDALPWAGGATSPQALGWDADEKGFVYARFPPPAPGHEVTQFHAAVVHHALGDPASADRAVFGADYSKIAEYEILTNEGARHLAVLAKPGDGAPWEVYLRRDGRFTRVIDASANVRSAAWDGQRLLVAGFAGAPCGKVLAVDAASGKVTPVLGQQRGALQWLAPIGSGFLAVRSLGPEWWVDQYAADGRKVRRVPLPPHGIAVNGIASEAGHGKALITFSGWTLPSRWAEYDAGTGALETAFQVKPAADYSHVVATHIEGTSKDGTRIPVTVLHLDTVTPNGQRPTILYSYGGFDLPVRPGFVGARLAWLERGGVYAFANIRGGNENGQEWHRAGQTVHKQNVFDDFFAAAQALEATHWTDRAHLGITGTSNGGLLMGAELTQHPGAFKAVVSHVGIYDMLRHMTHWINGAYNEPEYGNVRKQADFRAMLAYSPLQNVKPGTGYPAVLMTEGVNDQRVAPWQMRKFCAALQDATSARAPILCLTRMHAGHGLDASFAQRVGDTAISLSFFAQELGLATPPEPVK